MPDVLRRKGNMISGKNAVFLVCVVLRNMKLDTQIRWRRTHPNMCLHVLSAFLLPLIEDSPHARADVGDALGRLVGKGIGLQNAKADKFH